jgi:hypothetical protein
MPASRTYQWTSRASNFCGAPTTLPSWSSEMKVCFAFCARLLGWASGVCANWAWAEPPMMLCMSECCNRNLVRQGEEFRMSLSRLRQRMEKTLDRRYTI